MNSKVWEFYSQFLDLSTAVPDHRGEVHTVCPFHDDNRPSFSINTNTGLWKCHTGACPTNAHGNGGGTLTTFYMFINQCSSDEALNATRELENELSKARNLLKQKAQSDKELRKAQKEAEQAKVKAERYEQQKQKADERLKSRSAKKGERAKPGYYASGLPSRKMVKAWHDRVVKSQSILEYLGQNFRWSEDTVKRFRIGWDGERICIPIFEGEKLVNVRRYAPNPKDGVKIKGVAGHNKARIWPVENTTNQKIYLMEGEKDCILANQHGLNAVTITSGAGTWNDEWLGLFRDKNVYICYDIDDTGIKGARKIAEIIANVTRHTYIVDLPLEKPDNADFTDYIVQGHSAEAFLDLCASAEEVQPANTDTIRIPEEVHKTSLSKAMAQKLFYRRAAMKVRVIGKTDSAYMIPRKIRIKCNRNNGKQCFSCGLFSTADETLVLDETKAAMLEFLNASSKESPRIYKDLFDIAKCKKYTVEESEHQFIEDVQVIPTVDELADEDSESGYFGHQNYEERHMYFINKQMEMNTDYDVESIMFSHPSDKHIVHVGYKADRCQSSLEEFVFTDDMKQSLEKFKCQQE